MAGSALLTARTAVAGVFFGLLAGLILTWGGLAAIAIATPAAAVRHGTACPAPAPGTRPGPGMRGAFPGACRGNRGPGNVPGQGQGRGRIRPAPGAPAPGAPRPTPRAPRVTPTPIPTPR